jgi:hypothetical protein
MYLNPKFKPEDYLLIEGQTRDNIQHLPSEYIDDLEMMPEEVKKRHYYGSWDDLTGLVYEKFGAGNLCKGFFINGQWQSTIPSFWRKYRTIDFGIRMPTVCLWGTISPGGTIYIYDEYYSPGIVSEHAKAIKDKHVGPYQYTLIDPAAFNRESNGASAADGLFAGGVAVSRANNDLFSGLATVSRYMSDIDPETGRPKLQILEDKCPNLIRELKNYLWDEVPSYRKAKRNEPERPRKKNDHAADALRYLLMARPRPSTLPPQVIDPVVSAFMKRGDKQKWATEMWEPGD